MLVNTMDELAEAVRQLAEGQSGLRRLFYQLNYDYADALLPYTSDASLVDRFAASPRLIATTCARNFVVLWFPLYELDASTERRICVHYSRLYPFALYLFSKADNSVWHFACLPDEPEVDTDYLISLSLDALSPRVLERVARLAIDEEAEDDILNVNEQIIEVCASRRSQTASGGRTTNENRYWKDCTGWWLAQFSKYPLLDAREEARLARLAADGDITARNLLVNSNLRLVFKIAKRYVCPELPLPDLLQEGHLGLFRAVNKYDVALGYRFSTYATWWVRRGITRAIAEKARLIRLPVHIIEALGDLRQITSFIEQRSGQTPTTEMLASKMAVPIKRIELLLSVQHRVLSLESSCKEERYMQPVYGEPIPDVGTGMMQIALHDLINQALDTLKPRHRAALVLRYGLEDDTPRTLDEVGQLLNASRERIRQMESSGLQKLRRLGFHSFWCDFVSYTLVDAASEEKPCVKDATQMPRTKAIIPVARPKASSQSCSAVPDVHALEADKPDKMPIEVLEDDVAPSAAEIASLLIELESELVLRHPPSILRKARVHAGNSQQQPVFDFTDQA